jgi:hypothetical protein
MEYKDRSDEWLEKERTETTVKRMPDKHFDNIRVSNPGFGLNVYHHTFSKEQIDKFTSSLEDVLGSSGPYTWNEAQVTNSTTPIKKARDCVDFKMNAKTLGDRNPLNEKLLDTYNEIFNTLKNKHVEMEDKRGGPRGRGFSRGGGTYVQKGTQGDQY